MQAETTHDALQRWDPMSSALFIAESLPSYDVKDTAGFMEGEP